jgi:ABC-type multidrug transport system fused ATPase/permease subunit
MNYFRKSGQLSQSLLRKIFFNSLPAKIALSIFVLLNVCAGLAVPYFQKTFIDGLSDSGAIASIGVLALIFISAISAQLLSMMARMTSTKDATTLNASLSASLYEHAVLLSGQARMQKTTGQLATLYAQDLNAAVYLVEEFLPSFLQASIAICFAPVALCLWTKLSVAPILFTTLFRVVGNRVFGIEARSLC